MSIYHQTQHLARQMLGLGLWLLGLRPRRSSEAAAPLGAVLFGFKGWRRKQPTSGNCGLTLTLIHWWFFSMPFQPVNLRRESSNPLRSENPWNQSWSLQRTRTPQARKGSQKLNFLMRSFNLSIQKPSWDLWRIWFSWPPKWNMFETTEFWIGYQAGMIN